VAGPSASGDSNSGIAANHHQVLQLGDELLELSLHDLGPHVFRLPLGGHLLLGDAPLPIEQLRRDVRGRHADRIGRGDVKGDLARQLPERLVAGHEVGLAVELDQHPDLVVVVDVAQHDALRGGAARALLGLGDPFLAKDLGRLVHVAGGLFQGPLAVHHASAGPLPELAYVLG